MSAEPKTCLTDGSAPTPDYREIDPATGMQKGYLVLCPEERAKGFVRPVRTTYRHVGIRPKYPTRELTSEERERFDPDNEYVLFEPYPEGSGAATGRFWSKKDLESGCGTVTTMGRALAETYARDPKFYGGTFCCGCGAHFPVKEFVWEVDGTVVGS